MRLTKLDRAGFVAAVMADVPMVDFGQKAHDALLSDAVAKLPTQIRAIWKDASLRGFIRCDYTYYTPRGLSNVYLPIAGFKPSLDTEVFIKKCADDHAAQIAQHAELRDKVLGMINACTTLAQAIERLPEFVQYLPKERVGSDTKNLPAIANVVGDLTKAGWPKTIKRAKGGAA